MPPDEAARLRGLRLRRGVPLAHDALYEATAPHIASPDVHVDDANGRIVMYFHGLDDVSTQVTRVATSPDGIRFTARPERLGRTYMRVFRHDDYTYAMSMPGQFYRSKDPLGGFETGPLLFNPDMRHAALLKRGNTLFVFWTEVGETPERIKLSRIDIAGDWMSWQATPGVEVLRPERRLGRRGRAAGAVRAQHGLRPRQPAPRPGHLRGCGQRPRLPAVRRGGRERDRDRRSAPRG